MKLLTLYIDCRLDYVIDFDCRRDNTDVLGQFVVEADDDDVPLLSFYSSEKGKGSNGLILQDKQERVAYIKDVSVELKNSDEEQKTESIQMDVYLTTVEKTNYAVKNFDDTHLKFQEEGDKSRWTLIYHRPLDIEYTFVDVTIHLYDEGEDRVRNVKLYVSGADKIADVVLDFGSEASQMTIFNRDKAQDVNGIMPLFEDMYQLYGEDSKIYNDYLQYDDSEIELYKSVFFVKKEWTREEEEKSSTPILLDKATGKPIADPKVLVLTSKNEKEKIRHTYLNLPNVKIINYGGVKEPSILCDGSSERISEFGDNFFYRRCINHFIFNALNSISKKKDIPFVSFYLLMPNIYSHNKIFENLYGISIDIQEMLKSLTAIKGVELSMISESDASLLGTICAMRHEVLSDGNYLILDAGKGTLDFSVFKISSESRLMYRNLYRSGIVGAGNAVSYAFLLAILDHFYCLNTGRHPTESELQDYIYYNVLGSSEEGRANRGGDAFYLKELMEAVDDYKIAVGEKRGVQMAEIPFSDDLEDIKEIQVSTLADYIKGLVKDEEYQLLSEEEFRYVDKTIRSIVESVTSKLAAMKGKIFTSIKDMIFAGRGFEYKPLKEYMIRQLRDCGIIDEETGEIAVTNRLSAATPKNICLYLSTALINGHYNNRMIVVPAVAKAKIINDRDSSIRSNGFSIRKLWRKFIYNDSQETKETEKERSSLDFQSFINIVCNDNYNPGGGGETNDMVKGFFIPLSSTRDFLILGSTTYRPNIKIKGGARLFYGEDKLFLRDELEQEVHELRLGVDLETSSLVFASLFPACNPYSKEQVFIPEIERNGEEKETKEEKGVQHGKKTGATRSGKENKISHYKQNDDESLINEIKNMKETKL